MSRSNLPVVAGPVVETLRERPRPRVKSASGSAGAFDAQLFGQDGVRRGLKGGAPVLEAARAAYLETEFSGEADRRPPLGLLKVAKV